MLLKRNNQKERWQITFSKELNIKGDITYNTFKNEDEKDLLSSIYIYIYKENGYLSNNDFSFIKNLYFEKYGSIDESFKSEYYINDNQDKNYQEFNIDNQIKKSYQWNVGNLIVVLNFSNTNIEADYFYKNNILEEQGKSEIEEKVKDNF
jgi:hypothetical protein